MCDRTTGRVKWFNNNRGYGFITCSSETGDIIDVFAHHSDISTCNEQFVYLVEGEYVDFNIVRALQKDSMCVEDTDLQLRWDAKVITGYGGGKLMCETQNDGHMKQLTYTKPNYQKHPSVYTGIYNGDTDVSYYNSQYYGRGRSRYYGSGRTVNNTYS